MTGGPDPPPPGKSQVAIVFLRNTGTDPLGRIASRGRSVCPSVLCVDDLKKEPSDEIFWIRAWVTGLIFEQIHMLWPLIRTVLPRKFIER